MRRPIRRMIGLAALLSALLSGTALACGESLFRLGRGVNFREYSAPLPGNIIVVASTSAELAMAERLAAAGHDVHVIADPGLIGAEILDAEHSFDLVIAFYDQRDVVASQVTASRVAYLPVAHEGAEEAQVRANYSHYLEDQGSVKSFLRTIHAVLRARG